MLEVAADLVEAAGQGAGLDERVALEDREAAELGNSGSTGRARNRMIDDAFLRRDAAHQREIALLHFAGRELLLQPAGRAGVERQEQRAAGAPVETMHGVDAPVRQIADALQRHDAVPRRSPVHREARRFVDGQQEAVAVEDGKHRP